MANNELYHYGVKGMKWGVTRYRNSDGSLTLAGKKKALRIQKKYTDFSNDKKYHNREGNLTYSGRKKALKMKDRYSKITGGKALRSFPGSKKIKSTTSTASMKKKTNINEMSTEDLIKRTNRLNAEKNYIEAMNSRNSLTPKKVSRSKRFVSYMRKEIVKPAAANVGRQIASSLLTKATNKAFKFDGDLKVYTNNKRK